MKDTHAHIRLAQKYMLGGRRASLGTRPANVLKTEQASKLVSTNI
jgi:hypothetical protein